MNGYIGEIKDQKVQIELQSIVTILEVKDCLVCPIIRGTRHRSVCEYIQEHENKEVCFEWCINLFNHGTDKKN